MVMGRFAVYGCRRQLHNLSICFQTIGTYRFLRHSHAFRCNEIWWKTDFLTSLILLPGSGWESCRCCILGAGRSTGQVVAQVHQLSAYFINIPEKYRSKLGRVDQTSDRTVYFSISHRLSIVELRPSSSLSTGCVVSLRGDWAIFCHAGSERVGRVRSAREKSLEILRRGWKLNPGHGEDRQWAIPLSYHDWLTVYLTQFICRQFSHYTARVYPTAEARVLHNTHIVHTG